MLEAPIENKFFGMCIPLGYHFCVLPDILKTQKKTKFYTFLIYAPAIFFHTCEIFKLYQLTFGEFFIADECIRNFVITYLRFMILVKCFFLRGKLSGKIFTKILQYEEFIYKTEDKEVISIYESNLSRLKRINHFFLASNVVMVFFYGLAPSLRDSYYIQRGNETIEIPQYPLSIWTPVEHIYWCAYVWSTFAGVYIVILFVATEMILYSFIYSGICQIQILKQYIANFYRHAEILAQTYRYAEAESLRVLQKKYIKTHQEIIEYVPFEDNN